MASERSSIFGTEPDGRSSASAGALDTRASWDDMVLVGRVARTHGLRGDVVVAPETDFVEERFAEGATVWMRLGVALAEKRIARSRLQGGRAVLRFEGVDDIDSALTLVRHELRVWPTELQALPDGMVYQHELVGCAVETREGTAIGRVARVDGGVGGSLLVVAGDAGEVLVPFAEAICVEIDVRGRRIVVDAPPGLLELNVVTGTPKTRRRKRRGAVVA